MKIKTKRAVIKAIGIFEWYCVVSGLAMIITVFSFMFYAAFGGTSISELVRWSSIVILINGFLSFFINLFLTPLRGIFFKNKKS